MKVRELSAIEAFSALSQETRLRMLRALVRAGPKGLSAGDVGKKVDVAASNASFHLAHLQRAGLVSSRREARSIIYMAEFSTITALANFLLEDCCNG